LEPPDRKLGETVVKKIPVLLALVLAAGAAHAETAAQHYETCLAQAQANPPAALGNANNWIKSGGGIPAGHCAALALIGLHRYAEAANRLDALARERGIASGAMRSELLDQAGNAWMLAGQPANADASLSAALIISARDPDLFSDLARAHAMERDWKSAEADLNAALALAPGRPDLLVLRASARHAEGRKAQARADIDGVLRAHPDFPDALLERGELEMDAGDVAGARADWQRTIAAGPGSGAAQVARKHIADMDAAAKTVTPKRP
jgi:tetratricopeptide (TPR) repeat protein